MLINSPDCSTCLFNWYGLLIMVGNVGYVAFVGGDFSQIHVCDRNLGLELGKRSTGMTVSVPSFPPYLHFPSCPLLASPVLPSHFSFRLLPLPSLSSHPLPTLPSP